MIKKPEKEKFTAIPYRRGYIHQKTSIRTGEKFRFFSYPSGHEKETHLNLARLLGVYDEELAKMEAYDLIVSYGTANANKYSFNPPPWGSPMRTEMLRAYFYKTSLSSFAILNRGLSIVCGFRNKKDYFRYALKFGEITPVRFWYASDQFWVFIDENDPVPFERKDPATWNNGDPQAGWL